MMIKALVGVIPTASANPLPMVEIINPLVFLVLLGLGGLELKRAVCQLLWMLASCVPDHPIVKLLRSAKCLFTKVLKELQSLGDVELRKLSRYSLFYICPPDQPTDNSVTSELLYSSVTSMYVCVHVCVCVFSGCIILFSYTKTERNCSSVLRTNLLICLLNLDMSAMCCLELVQVGMVPLLPNNPFHSTI